ncbi:DJ-1/PfpI family protein [Flavobacterium sp. CYK-55]|uniref:GlxA family transcriptional regulator n=1 Tax=Flavobacterium sp. CYK-55 TaxID=2835529 RepID=UPI001BCAD8C9|nr:DJ-1/PfpI family protein [Flavobacterium sp. CYK-55]MBS7788184.1 DJ-1/PfpI family protein [Flavobacterium sp. CYK-55]
MRPTRFVFLILPEVHLLDLAGADQVISESIDFGAPFSMEYCGLESSINTSAGMGIHQLKHFSEVLLTPGDFLIIPGARVRYIESSKFKKNTALFEWIAQAFVQKVHLVSICVGSFVLAYSGVLDGRMCTTHFQLTQKMQQQFPKTKVKDNVLFVSENTIHTSAGIASGIDLMLHLLEQITDSYFAHKVARELVVYNRRDGDNAQLTAHFNYRNHIHQGIHKVQDYLIENLHQKNNLSVLAEIAVMSERNLTRIFKKETGLTINAYLNKIRVEKLIELQKSPDLSKKQRALQVGLTSEKQAERLLKKLA